MNNRHVQLIQYLLQQNNWINGSQLAAYLNVSPRTIRNDIQAVQAIGFEITSSKKEGYRIENSVTAKKLLQSLNHIPGDSQQRMVYVLKQLLHSSVPKNIFDMADHLYVSESTMEKDLNRLKLFLADTNENILLKRVENTITLEGNIREKRTIWSKMLLNEVKENLFDINAFESQFHTVDITEIHQLLVEILSTNKLHLNDLAIISMVIHITIVTDTILRNEETIPSVEINFNCTNDELSAAQSICDKLENLYMIKIPPAEKKYIAILLGGKRSFDKEKPYEIDGQRTDSFFTKLTNELLTAIHKTFYIDLRQDKQLSIDLSMHLKTLYNRNKRNVQIHNPILKDIQKRYPLLYDMGIFMGMQYESKTGQKINEDEIGLLTLHFCIAFERLAKMQKQKKRLAIICPTGVTTSRLLKENLLNTYTEQIDKIRLFSISDSNAIDEYKPDLILTTSKLPNDFAFQTIEVTPFLSEPEKNKLNKYFQPVDKMMAEENANLYFQKELFFKDMKAGSPAEVIEFIALKLEEMKIVPKKYSDLILAREAISSTAYGNLIALPHPIEKVAHKTLISVCILEKPIQWGSQKVQVVLLFALANDKTELMDSLFRKIINLLDSRDKVKKVLQAKDFNSFIQLIS